MISKRCPNDFQMMSEWSLRAAQRVSIWCWTDARMIPKMVFNRCTRDLRMMPDMIIECCIHGLQTMSDMMSNCCLNDIQMTPTWCWNDARAELQTIADLFQLMSKCQSNGTHMIVKCCPIEFQTMPTWSSVDAHMLVKGCRNDVQMLRGWTLNDVRMIFKWCSEDFKMMRNWCSHDARTTKSRSCSCWVEIAMPSCDFIVLF